jgi:hypothetical protein
VSQTPSTDDLRDAIGRTLQDHVKSYNLGRVCSELGIVVPNHTGLDSNSKRVTVLNWLPNDRDSILSIAERVLERFSSYHLEELVWMAREQSVEFTELARRNIVATLGTLPEPWGQLDAKEVIGRIIPLGEGLLNAVLSESELQDVKGVCELYNVLNTSGRRFRRFIERIVHPSVRNEEEQKRYAGALNVELRKSGWELRVSDSDAGRSLYAHCIRWSE